MWDTVQTREFLSMWYQHNKANFGRFFDTPEGVFGEDPQQKLARIIFQNVDIRLRITNTDRLTQFLDKYINDFILNKLDRMCKTGLTNSFFASSSAVPLHTKFYGFEKQKNICLEHIKAMYDDYRRFDLEITNPFIEPEYVGDMKAGDIKITPVTNNRDELLFLFVHTMLALENEKIITINDLSYGTTEIFDMYDRGFQFKITYNPDNIIQKNSVSSVTFVEPHNSDGQYRLYLNNNVDDAKKLQRGPNMLKNLIKLAKNPEGSIEYDENFYRYINYNKGNALFSNKYKTTEIVEKVGSKIHLSPAIKCEVISYKEFKKKTEAG
jgi:hypothetical protein